MDGKLRLIKKKARTSYLLLRHAIASVSEPYTYMMETCYTALVIVRTRRVMDM